MSFLRSTGIHKHLAAKSKRLSHHEPPSLPESERASKEHLAARYGLQPMEKLTTHVLRESKERAVAKEPDGQRS